MRNENASRGGVSLLGLFLLSGILLEVCLLGISLSGAVRPTGLAVIASRQEAMNLLEQGRLTEARRSFYGALYKDPENVEAIRSLAYCALADGDLLEATSLFRTWTELEPENSSAWKEFSRTLGEAGRALEADLAAHRGLALVPCDFELKALAPESVVSPAESDHSGNTQATTLLVNKRSIRR